MDKLYRLHNWDALNHASHALQLVTTMCACVRVCVCVSSCLATKGNLLVKAGHAPVMEGKAIIKVHLTMYLELI